MQIWKLYFIPILAIGFTVGGCSISSQDAFDLREAPDADAAIDNQENLLEALSEPSENVKTRLIAMESAVILTNQYTQLRNNRLLYPRLTTILVQDLKSPRIRDGVATPHEISYLRCWALDCLSRLNDPSLIGKIIDVILSSDSELTACALNALVPHLELFRFDRNLRRKLLTALTRLSPAPSYRTPPTIATVDQLELRRFFESNLYNLSTVNEILTEAVDAPVDKQLLEQALNWDYRLLLYGLNTPGVRAEANFYQESIKNLLKLGLKQPAYIPSELSKQARIILLEIVPLRLFSELVAICRDKTNYPDILMRELLYTLPHLPDYLKPYIDGTTGEAVIRAGNNWIINEADLAAPDRVARVTEDAKKLCWSYARSSDTAKRELVYSALFDLSPTELANFAISRNRNVLSENEEAVRQQARLLGNIRDHPALATDTELQTSLTQALADLVAVDSAPVRDLIAAYLIKSDPEVLAGALASPLRRMGAANSESVFNLVGLYLNALNSIENRPEKQKEATRLFSAREDLPYAVLAVVFERPEHQPKSWVAAFLAEREPETLVKILTQSVGADDYNPGLPGRAFNLILLNEVLLQEKAAIQKESLNQAVQAIGKSINKIKDEETALLTVRGLAELKHPIAKKILEQYARRGPGWESVRLICESASGAKVP